MQIGKGSPGLRISVLLLVLGLTLAPAWAGEIPVSNTNAFGNLISSGSNGPITSSTVNFAVSVSVFHSAGVYTYVYTISVLNSSHPLSQISVGGPASLFSSALSYGVVTGSTFTTMNQAGSDGSDTLFQFRSSSVNIMPPCTESGTVCDSNLAAGTQLTFYLQSTYGPGTVNISAQNGSDPIGSTTIGPGNTVAAAEPPSMALLAGGLLLVGGLRRRVSKVLG